MGRLGDVAVNRRNKLIPVLCSLGAALWLAAVSPLAAQQGPGPIEPADGAVAIPKPKPKGPAKQDTKAPAKQAAAAATKTTPAAQNPTPAALSAPAPGQPGVIPFKPEEPEAGSEIVTFRSDVKLVRMLATVRDAHGGLAGNLARDEFSIIDDGVPQRVALFEATTAQPLSVALLIDCSRSTQRERRTELDAVRTFARSLFKQGNPLDVAAIYAFNADVTLEAAWTRKPELIDRAVGRLHSEGATALYDAIHFGMQDLRTRDGRRVAVVVSDGGDTFSRTTFQKALEAAHAADAIVYSVIVVPVAEEPGRNTGGEHALQAMATSTGGRVFFPATDKDLDGAFAEILRDLRTQYLVGFYPNAVPPGRDRFHTVRLAVGRPGYTVSSRTGYYEPAPAGGFRPVK